MRPNLTPRAIVALSTAGISLFLLLCFAGYGTRDALSAMPPNGWSDKVAAWFIRPLGAGAHVIAALGLAWGVIVYFQERTPDLVLRLAGVTALAASTAVIVGLVHGGDHSVWAGTVGTAGAHMMTSLGTFGRVLGWLVFPALFIVSLFFATDSLFHSLRRGARAAFDPRKLPTEPSRGDLLDEPADAEPREFVASPSRAAEFVEVIEVQERKPLEVLPEALPKGFSAAPMRELGGRTVVRGPSGYEGVEFLPTSDELAPPEVVEETASFGEESEMVHSYEYDLEYFDAPLEGGEAPVETPVPVAAAPAVPAPAPVAAVPEPVAEPVAPAGGIALADESLLIDEFYAMPASFDEAAGPSDGASAAGEITSNWETGEIAPALAVDRVAAEAISTEVGAGEIPAPVAAAEEPAAPRFDDDVVLGSAMFTDDVYYLVDEFPGAAVAESPVAATPAPAPAVEPSAPAATAVLDRVVEAVPENAMEHVPQEVQPTVLAAAAPVAVEAPVTFEAADADWVADESVLASAPSAEIPSADVAAADVAAVAAPADAAHASEAAPAAEALDVVQPMETTDSAAEAVAVVAEAPAPAILESPAAVVAATPDAAQLALFPAPSFDATKLAGMDLDPLFSEAAKAILTRGRASAVVLQRALGIGYARGLRILDQMTTVGMLGPDSPGGAREICFSTPPL